MQRLTTVVTLTVGLLALVAPALAEPTLAAVKKRGELACGINGQLPASRSRTPSRNGSGFAVDYCRAVAAAVLVDGRKVRFVPLTAAKRFDALRDGSIDVLMRNTTATLERTARTGVRDAVVTFVDGQAVVAAKTLRVNGEVYERNVGKGSALKFARGINALWYRGG